MPGMAPRRLQNGGTGRLSQYCQKLDIHQGGRFEGILHGPDGTDYPNLYIFNHVEEHKLLVYTNVGSEQFGPSPFPTVFDLEGIGNKTWEFGAVRRC